MYQQTLPGIELRDMEKPQSEKRHAFISIMSEITHLAILSSTESTAWDRLARKRVNYPEIFELVVDTLESL